MAQARRRLRQQARTMDFSDVLHLGQHTHSAPTYNSYYTHVEMNSIQGESLSFLDDSLLAAAVANIPAIERANNSILDNSVVVISDSPSHPSSPVAVIDLCSSPEPDNEKNIPPSPQCSGILRCPICFCNLQNTRQVVTTKCGHLYCQPCILKNLKTAKNCPICRHKLRERDLIQIYLNANFC